VLCPAQHMPIGKPRRSPEPVEGRSRARHIHTTKNRYGTTGCPSGQAQSIGGPGCPSTAIPDHGSSCTTPGNICYPRHMTNSAAFQLNFTIDCLSPNAIQIGLLSDTAHQPCSRIVEAADRILTAFLGSPEFLRQIDKSVSSRFRISDKS